MSKSKFDGVLKAVRPAATATPADAAKKPRGRPTGKHSNEDYKQYSVYIRKATRHAAEMKLTREHLTTDGHGRDFSELVEDLVAAWAKARD